MKYGCESYDSRENGKVRCGNENYICPRIGKGSAR